MATHRTAERSAVTFRASVSTIDDTALVQLPEPASRQLPSRGQVAVRATVDGHPFDTVVEPDGRRGHWIRLDDGIRRSAGIGPGDAVELTLDVAAQWPEPHVPDDLAGAIASAPERVRMVWDEITPQARWEWVRWVQQTRNEATRRRRVEVTLSKIDAGKRRPCCFDLSSCTDPDLARSGRLRDPS